jgi:N-methylhydantoinase A
MLRALRLVSVQRGHDLRAFTLVAYGGAGPLHAGALARLAGIPRVVVPVLSGAFSALGCLVSPLRYDAVQSCGVRLEDWDDQRLEGRFADLEERCRLPLLDEGLTPASLAVRRSIDLRYVGQNYELEIPYQGDPARLRAAFEARHRQLYGYATGERLEGVALRVTASAAGVAAAPPPAVAPDAGGVVPVGEQFAYFSDVGQKRLPRYDRSRLSTGCRLDGPALVEDESSTVLVHPGQRCRADEFGNLVIEEQG